MEEKLTMEERFKLNQIKMRNRRQEQLKRLKREERKENILFGIVAGFIIIATMMLLMNMNNDFVNDCVKAGNTKQYCEKGLE